MIDTTARATNDASQAYRPVDWVPARPRAEVRDGVVYLGSDIPLVVEHRNLIDLMLDSSRTWPDRVFLSERTPDGGWADVTFAEFADKVARAAQALEPAIADGAATVLLARNSIASAVATFAVMARGAVLVPLSTAYLGRPGGEEALAALAAAVGAQFALVDEGAPECGLTCPIRTLPGFEDGDERFDLAAAADAIAPDRLAKILFTSGSTGFPKAVPNTHGMLAAAAAMIHATQYRLSDGRPQVQVDWLPWHHTFGGNVNLHAAFSMGGRFVIDGGGPTPEGFPITIRNLAEIGPTGLSTVPAAYPVLIQAMRANPALAQAIMRNLHSASYGGAALPPPVAAAFQDLAVETTGGRMLVGSGYGMTETSGILARVHWPTDRTDLLGLPAPGVEIKLTPQGDGRFDCRVRGPNIFQGYGLDGDRSAFDEEGFFVTGDAMTAADPDDWRQGLVYAGRIAEDFKLSTGVFVQAGRLRLALLDHLGPAVRDVLIVGEGQAGVGCLIWPMGADADAGWLDERIASFNADRLGPSRTVARHALLADPPHARPDELTQKGGLNGPRMRETRKAEIERLFG